MSPQTVCFVANSSYSMFNFRAGVLAAMLEDGHRVVVVAPGDDYTQLLRDMGAEFWPISMERRGANPLKDFLFFLRLAETLRRIGPGLVFAYTIKPVIYGALAARLLGVPSICIITGLGHVFTSRGAVSRVAKSLYKFSLRFPREVWFLNEDDRSTMVAKQLVPVDATRVLPSEGIDLEVFSPHSASNLDMQPGQSRGTSPTFLFLGRLLWEKGVGELVEAARTVRSRHPRAEFRLLGPADSDRGAGVGRERLAAWENEGVISYCGVTRDVRPALREVDCIVLPSYYAEGVPRSLLEAAACGLPVITTDNVGCREAVIDGRTGFLCQPRSAEDLAAKIEAFLRLSPDERLAMGAQGRAYVRERFDLKQVIEIYRNILRSRGAGQMGKVPVGQVPAGRHHAGLGPRNLRGRTE